VCLILCDLETSKRGGLSLSWAVAPQEKSKRKNIRVTCDAGTRGGCGGVGWGGIKVQFYSFLALAQDVMGGNHHGYAAKGPRKEIWYPVYRRLGGPQGWSGRMWRKFLVTTGVRTQNRPVLSSRYINYATPAH
jgi:hypothetical protein